MKRFLHLFDFSGTIGPLHYLLTGVAAMLLKYPLDALAAAWLRHEPWKPWDYLDPVGTSMGLPPNDHFLIVMSCIALPFAWLGLSVTVKRLRSLRGPISFIVFFFIPFINLLFFMLLSVIPAAKDTSRNIDSYEGRAKDAFFAIMISLSVAIGAVFLAAKTLTYGIGVFVAAPFCVGLVSAVVYSWNRPRKQKECVAVAMGACIVVGIGLLCFAFEGLICIAMLAPFALALAALGAVVGHRMQPNLETKQQAGLVLALLAIFPTVAITAEHHSPKRTEEFQVTSSVEVNAPPEVVWKHVVTFSQLQEPTEMLFRSGIAYPMRAEIEGHGVGAVRYCVFSTGPFIEPITVWDEPHMLEFKVTQVPAPMNELSPYPGLHPPHLDGFFVSHKGHFVLTALPGGRTKLEGTTWYEHNLWPSNYWALWSDYIIHRIHMRVLEHVKDLAERDVSQ